MADDKKPINRRRFFREGLRELLRPLAQAIEPIERVSHELGKLGQEISRPAPEPYRPPPAPDPIWLRPPGARLELEFLDTCSRCGDCVRVCPAQCIKIDASGELGGGAPYIDVDAMPCVLCDGLLCMPACPTSALQITPKEELQMGLAIWNESLCLRTTGQDCTICVDKCPMGTTGLKLVENRIEVQNPGCTGCGVCQYSCPTYPKSITVAPKAALNLPPSDIPPYGTD
jgi:ferredoxin-type protein NapG